MNHLFKNIGNESSLLQNLISQSPSPSLPSPWGSKRHRIGRSNTLSPSAINSILASMEFTANNASGKLVFNPVFVIVI